MATGHSHVCSNTHLNYMPLNHNNSIIPAFSRTMSQDAYNYAYYNYIDYISVCCSDLRDYTVS